MRCEYEIGDVVLKDSMCFVMIAWFVMMAEVVMICEIEIEDVVLIRSICFVMMAEVVIGMEEDLDEPEVELQSPWQWVVVGKEECLIEVEFGPQPLAPSDLVYSRMEKDLFGDVEISEMATKVIGLKVV